MTVDRPRTEAEAVAAIAALPGVVAMTASRETGAPEVAWGDTFFFHDPEGDGDRRFPFVTLVTKDYPGFDEASELNRPRRLPGQRARRERSVQQAPRVLAA